MEVKCKCGGIFEGGDGQFECNSCDEVMSKGMHGMKLNALANRENERRMNEDRKKANVGVKRSHRLGKK